MVSTQGRNRSYGIFVSQYIYRGYCRDSKRHSLLAPAKVAVHALHALVRQRLGTVFSYSFQEVSRCSLAKHIPYPFILMDRDFPRDHTLRRHLRRSHLLQSPRGSSFELLFASWMLELLWWTLIHESPPRIHPEVTSTYWARSSR